MIGQRQNKWVAHRWLIFTSLVTITDIPLIQSAVGILLDSINATTASKPNVVCTTTVLK